jgi:hypothetical protein
MGTAPPRTIALRAERPEALGRHLVRVEGLAVEVLELARDVLGLLLGVLGLRKDLALLDLRDEVRVERLALHVEAVVLVRRLGQARLGALGLDRLAVRHDGVADLDRGAAHELVLEVVQADLEVQLAGAGDDVLARLLLRDEHERV